MVSDNIPYTKTGNKIMKNWFSKPLLVRCIVYCLDSLIEDIAKIAEFKVFGFQRAINF